jgi:GTP cyclohydrolase I
MFARRLQMQGRLAQDMAATLEQVPEPEGVAVVIESIHVCMMMRGLS